MNIKLKNDIPVCQRARRLSGSEKLQVNIQIDDWLRQSIIKETVFDYCSPIVLCKKVNGAMKTSSVEFISRSPTPSPMKSKQRRFAMLRRIFEPWQWKRRKKRDRFEQTSRTLERKISMHSTKDQLIKKDVLMPVKHKVFLWNLPDVEEVPSHDGETVYFSRMICKIFVYLSYSPCLFRFFCMFQILLWSPWTYRCGQRTVRLAGYGIQQSSLRAQAQ
ncbi:phosphatase and actin regulator 2 [Trichonephila clavipes]|nr:phosphatase and actin regulator 2 [Trichonephila clavipes]